jgi:hypothetical protein
MFLISCNSAPIGIEQGRVESKIYTKDVTAKGVKKRIVVGEHGGYWEYQERVSETGCSFDVKTEVSDDFCLNEWSYEERQFPDTKLSEPYKCICTVGWTYHSVEGDSSPAMNWNILFVAAGDVALMGNSLVTFGGKAHNTAEAVSSAKVACNNVVLRSEQLNEKVEGSILPSLRVKSFLINTQHNGVLPAGSKSIELVAELSASVKAKAKAQAGFMNYLSPSESRARSHSSVTINSLRFTSFNRVEEEQKRLAASKYQIYSVHDRPYQ